MIRQCCCAIASKITVFSEQAWTSLNDTLFHHRQALFEREIVWVLGGSNAPVDHVAVLSTERVGSADA